VLPSAGAVHLSEAGADPDAPVVREFGTGRNPSSPQVRAIPLYSGRVGNNCAYWREHPESVVAAHQLANYLSLTATAGRVGYQ
jgi:hypothetical protein